MSRREVIPLTVALVAACLVTLGTPVALAHADSLHINVPREIVLGKTFVVRVSGKAHRGSAVWVYFSYRRCAPTARGEASRGYSSFHRRVGQGAFSARVQRVARRGAVGSYCAYLYRGNTDTRRHPAARAERPIAFFLPDLPPQGRRPVGHNADGRHQLFLIGSDGQLYTSYQSRLNANRWSKWVSLEGTWPTSDAIGVGFNGDGRQQIYVIGYDNKLYTSYQKRANKNLWSPWVSLWNQPAGYWPNSDSIGVGTNADGRQEVYLTDGAGDLFTSYQRRVNALSWSDWLGFGGPFPDGAAIGVGSGADGRQYIYLIYQDEKLYTRYQNHVNTRTTYGWSDWISLEGYWYSYAGITVGADASGRQELYVVGINQKLYTQRQLSPNGSWPRSWTPLTEKLFPNADAVGVGRRKDGRQELYLIGSNGRVYTQTQLLTRCDTPPCVGDWSLLWTALGGPWPTNDFIGVARDVAGREQLYLMSAGGALYTKRAISASGSAWQRHWLSLEGSWPPQ